LLLFSEKLHISELCGVIDGHEDPVVAEAGERALRPVAGDAVQHLVEPGQFLKSI